MPQSLWDEPQNKTWTRRPKVESLLACRLGTLPFAVGRKLLYLAPRPASNKKGEGGKIGGEKGNIRPARRTGSPVRRGGGRIDQHGKHGHQETNASEIESNILSNCRFALVEANPSDLTMRIRNGGSSMSGPRPAPLRAHTLTSARSRSPAQDYIRAGRVIVRRREGPCRFVSTGDSLDTFVKAHWGSIDVERSAPFP